MRIKDHQWRVMLSRTGLVVGILVAVLTGTVSARSVSPHHGFLGGPWEVIVQMGHDGQTLRLPVAVADENKAQVLQGTVPVMGTPIKVTLNHYLPDLKWETVAADDPNGGAVARLSLRGEGLKQDLWLSAQEAARQSVSSHIGGVAIRDLPAGTGSAEALGRLAEPDMVGVLVITLPGAERPKVHPVKPGVSMTLSGSSWKVSVPRYVAHYSIDRQTKEVVSASDKPVNPAVEITLEGDGHEYRQWLWSKFPSSPHKRISLPFPVRFLDFHPAAEAGQYLLAVTPGAVAKVLSVRGGKRHIEDAEFGKRFPFKDNRYSFAVEEVRFGAKVRKHWANASDVLLHPAVVATIGQAEATEEIVLEQGKPYHHKTTSGTLVVLYRRVP